VNEEHVGQIAGKSCVSTWKGLRVKLADGSSFLTEDTEELANRYGRAKNQRGTSRSYPVPKLLALLDLTSGMICKVIARTLPSDSGRVTVYAAAFTGGTPN